MSWLFNNKILIYSVKKNISNGVYIFLISFFLLSFSIEDSSAQMARGPSPKRHILYGSIELSYEQRWTEDDSDSTEFSQNYHIGLRSFIIDPRLINFNTSVTLASTTSNVADDSTLNGINLNINLLETPPRRWRGVRRFIPGPIMLSYSNFSNTYDFTHYGIRLIYSLPEILKETNKNAKKKGGIPLPIVYFDYDKNEYEFEDYKSTTDLYSLRAILNRKDYSHTLHYEHLDQEGTTDFERDVLTLRSNYRFYDGKTKKKTDVDILFKLQEIGDRDQLSFSSNLKWRKPFKKDTLFLWGGVDYSRSSWEEETNESYTTSVSGSYTKTFSPKTINTTSLSLSYGETDDSTLHSERLSDSITVDLSRVFRSSSGVFLGNTEKGTEYGLNTLLSTKTRIRTSAGYFFSSLSQEDEERLTHSFTLSASGPLRYNVNLNTTTSYTIRDVSNNILGPYSEDIFHYSANLFWRLPKTIISFNGNYSQTIKQNDEDVETRIVSLNNRLSRLITRRTLLNIYTTWTKELDKGSTSFNVRPIFRWRIRELSLDVEYNYRETTSDDTASPTEHRFLVRVVRRFSRLL